MIKKLVLLFIFILTGCSSATSTNTKTPTASPVPVISTTPTTITISPTSTPIYTAIPTVVGFQWAQDAPVSACIPVQSELPAGLHLAGLLLGDEYNPRVLDPNSGDRTNGLEPDQYDNNLSRNGYHLSPDGKWLAYVELGYKDDVWTSYKIFVEPADNILTHSSKGRFVAWQAQKPNDLFNFTGWVSNTAIAIAMNPNNYGVTIVHNPFTGQQTKFVLEQLPDFETAPVNALGTYIFGQSDLLPDPTLTRLIYPASRDNDTNAALWDVKNKKKLGNTFHLDSNPFWTPPGWSLDGSDFIMQGFTSDMQTEWFQTTKEGEVRQLTHFEDYLPAMWTGKSSRSWDGRYLAFWIGSDSDQDRKLLVMDLKSATPQGFCIDENSNKDAVFISPIWSPDSKYVVLSDGDRGGLEDWTLINVEKREAYQIAKDVDFSALGWMAVDQPLPTATPTPNTSPTPTVTPTATATFAPDTFATQCLDVLNTLPEDLGIHEAIMYSNFRSSANASNMPDSAQIVSDLHADSSRVLSHTIYTYNESISPDGKWIAYNGLSEFKYGLPDFLGIESADGNHKMQLPWDAKWLAGQPHWLDSEHLLLNVVFDPEKSPPEIPSIVVINPFTNELRYLRSNFPDIETITELPSQGQPYTFGDSAVFYNPALTLALYAKPYEKGNIEGRPVVLWNVKAGHAITTLPNFSSYIQVFWSTSEEKFILPFSNGKGVNNWFSLDQDGHLEQLTYFEKNYDWSTIGFWSSLSPDGEAIAFMMRTPTDKDAQFFVLNLQMRKLTKYCFKIPSSTNNWDMPSWSQDGHFLIISTDNPEQKQNNYVEAYLPYLINLERNWIVTLEKSNYRRTDFLVEENP